MLFWHFLLIHICFMFQNAPFEAEINSQKCCCQMRLSSPKYTKMRLWQGLGELTVSAGPIAGFQRPLRGRGRGKRGEERRGSKEETKRGRKGRGAFSHFFLLQFNY